MSDTAAHMDVSVHLYASTVLRVHAFENSASGYGREFVCLRFGDLGDSDQVQVLVRNVDALDRLMDAVADARTALLRVTREADVRQPELLAS
ncbi:MAG: hypothetical protein ACRDQA_26380 [Nocardioidaceae bacterium]